METCVSNIISEIAMQNKPIEIETTSGLYYEGIIENEDCLGIMLKPTDIKSTSFFIPYTSIQRFIMQDHV